MIPPINIDAITVIISTVMGNILHKLRFRDEMQWLQITLHAQLRPDQTITSKDTLPTSPKN